GGRHGGHRRGHREAAALGNDVGGDLVERLAQRVLGDRRVPRAVRRDRRIAVPVDVAAAAGRFAALALGRGAVLAGFVADHALVAVALRDHLLPAHRGAGSRDAEAAAALADVEALELAGHQVLDALEATRFHRLA